MNRRSSSPSSHVDPLESIPRGSDVSDLEPLESRVLMSSGANFDVFIDPAPGGLSASVPIVRSLAGDAPVIVDAASAAPSALKATYALVAGKGTISLSWRNTDPKATGYVVWHAVGANPTFTIVGRIIGAATVSFSEVAPLANTTYAYKVAAINATGTSETSEAVSVVTPMTSPWNVAAQMVADTINGGSYVSVFWMHSDPGVTGFAVFRSEAGGPFVKIGQTSGRSLSDSTTAPDTAYRYQVQALGGDKTSPLSGVAMITTSPVTPTGLAAEVRSGKVMLGWAANDPKATGYEVWRSSDGISFKLLATVAGAGTKTYADATLAAGDVGYYRVLTRGPGGSSRLSGIVEVRLPAAPGWSITTRFGNELVFNDAPSSDRIRVSQTGSTIVFVINGVSVTKAATAGGLFVYLRDGNNSVSIDASVTTRVTVQSINGLNDEVSVFLVNANVWIDQDDTFTGSANVHRVGAFAGGVSKARGASLPEPADARATVSVNQSLFGVGVAASDANQGQLGDCYFISALASLANTSPRIILGSGVDMGDGTYAVQYVSSGQTQFYRVSNRFASPAAGLTTLLFANGGSSGKMWAAVFEKAYAYCRRDTNTYGSLNGGYFGEVHDLFGLQSRTFNPASYSDANLYGLLSSTLAAGKAVEFATTLAPPNLVRAHGYSLLSVSRVNGVNLYVVRNPWGFAGGSLEGRGGIATLTYGQLVANFAGGTMAA